jgi:hypothetical protein
MMPAGSLSRHPHADVERLVVVEDLRNSVFSLAGRAVARLALD